MHDDLTEQEQLERECAHIPEAQFYANPVTASYEVVATQGARTVDGVLLDHFTASAIVAVAEALSPANRAKLETMSLERAALVCLKLVRT